MTQEAKLQTIPKKSIIILLVVVGLYALLIVTISFFVSEPDYRSSQMSKQSLDNWKTVGFLLSLYTQTTPWRWQKKIVSRANQKDTTVRQIWGMLILFCFVPFIAPLIYGLVLIIWGLSMMELFYFVGISVLSVLAWSIYNFRTNS